MPLRTAAAALLPTLTAPPQAANATTTTCKPVRADVAMTSGGPTDQRVAGTLCLPRGRAATVHLLIPGDSCTPPSINKNIQVPVLIVTGEHDRLLVPTRSSAALRAQEAPFYGPRAELEAIVVPGTGHVLNVHRTASGWFAKARDLADRRVGGAAR